MKQTTTRQTILIAGFLFAGATALNAQSRSDSAQDTKSKEKPAKVELISLNTPKVSSYSVTPSSIPTPLIATPETQADRNKKDQDSQAHAAELVKQAIAPIDVRAQAQAAAQARAAELVKQENAPSEVRTAATKDTTSNQKNSWFTAGVDAFPPPVRMDLSFGLPVNPYGAGPAAVAFNFGKQ